MFRFKYSGRREEEDLDLGPRLLREMGPVIEDDLSRQVGWAKVERGRLGRSLKVTVNPHEGGMDPNRQVSETVGRTLLENLMPMALYNATAPVISESGNLATGGRVNADRLGL